MNVHERIADRQRAEALALTAEHYAKAFRISAHICRSRAGETAAGQQLSRIFEEKARLEDQLKDRLKADPILTLREEGLA